MKHSKSSISYYLYRLLAFALWVLIFINLPRSCTGNNNQQRHSRGDESPSFQYSKRANEPYLDSTLMQTVQKIWNWVCTMFINNFLILTKKGEGTISVWMQALGSTVLISAAPFMILFLVPLDANQEKQSTLKILLSFASGGLLGDSFLHLIPHSLSSHSHGHNHHHNHHHHQHHHHHHGHNGHSHRPDSHAHDTSHLHIDPHAHEDVTGGSSAFQLMSHAHSQVGFFVLLGIVVFLVIEKSVRLVNKGHSHSHNVEHKKKDKDVTGKDSKDSKKGNSGKKPKQKEVLSVAGYLNLAADFAHNLTDGLAIGASYLAGRNIGVITTVTILFHEIPHEIGDFAILIQSGCSRKKAMALQLVTALGAVFGTLIALMANGAGDLASTWILPFTAGGFIYISTVSILPELLEDSNFFQSLKEIAAMLVGVLLMIVIADYE